MAAIRFIIAMRYAAKALGVPSKIGRNAYQIARKLHLIIAAMVSVVRLITVNVLKALLKTKMAYAFRLVLLPVKMAIVF